MEKAFRFLGEYFPARDTNALRESGISGGLKHRYYKLKKMGWDFRDCIKATKKYPAVVRLSYSIGQVYSNTDLLNMSIRDEHFTTPHGTKKLMLDAVITGWSVWEDNSQTKKVIRLTDKNWETQLEKYIDSVKRQKTLYYHGAEKHLDTIKKLNGLISNEDLEHVKDLLDVIIDKHIRK